MIIAIDPGPTESAYVICKGSKLVDFGKVSNEWLLANLKLECGNQFAMSDVLVVEMIASYGMPVGAEVFDTCVWIGRFVQACDRPYRLMFRRDVKLHLCGSVRAKDGNVRQALIDLYGGKAKAIGKKAQPGLLHGVSGDVWAALGVAVTYEATIARKVAA